MSQGTKRAGDEGYIDLLKGLISRVRAEPGYYLAVSSQVLLPGMF